MVICATHQNLKERMAAKTFREDLYYRLNGMVIKLPALRERTDLEVIVNKILEVENQGKARILAPEVMNMVCNYHWPGNFRQLSNVLKTAVIMCDDAPIIQKHHLPTDFLEDVESSPAATAPRVTLTDAKLDNIEASLIRQAIEAHGGNVSAAARQLGISRNTIYRKMGNPV
jgi:transcriptional regulator of acetoin/glycerol metabolism